MVAAKLTSRVAEKILIFLYFYAQLFGVVTIGYRRVVPTGKVRLLRWSLFPSRGGAHGTQIVVFTRTWFTRFCVAMRIFCIAGFYYGTVTWFTADQFFNQLILILNCVMLFCSLGIIILQLRLDARFVSVINSFLRLFRRIQHLAPHYSHVGRQQFTLLALTFLSLSYELASDIPTFLSLGDYRELALLTMHTYLGVSIVVTQHVTSVGYITIGALYGRMNSFVCDDFDPRARQLCSLLRRNANWRSKYYRMQLMKLTSELEECASIYASIYRSSQAFHRCLQAYLFYSIGFSFSALTMVCYTILYEFISTREFSWDFIIFACKILFDNLLFTLSAYSAVHNAELAKRISLDNLYMRGDLAWEQSVELLLFRLDFDEFKLNLLGLFDISNEVVLMFISGIVTFLTYIWQVSLQNQQWLLQQHGVR